jgi:hypothetical protein
MTESGSTVLETLVVLAIMGLGLSLSTVYLSPDNDPLESGTEAVEGLCRQARVSAIATSSAYRISPASSDRMIAESAASCNETTWTVDGSVEASLPEGVTLVSTSWNVCFSSRGVASENREIRIQHSDFGSTGVEVLIGGTTRLVP